MAWRTARSAAPPSASSTCAISRMATSFTWNPGARVHSPSSRIWSWIAAPSTASLRRAAIITAPTGSAPDGNDILIPKETADISMDAAACIGCGACVAMCPNAAAALFTAAKITHLGVLPQGQPERYRRAVAMVAQVSQESFGYCTNVGECEAVCPKEIPARSNRPHEPRFPKGRSNQPRLAQTRRADASPAAPSQAAPSRLRRDYRRQLCRSR